MADGPGTGARVLEIFELLFNWKDAVEYGTDVTAYLIMALVGTVFFVLRLLLALFVGDGGDGDVGMDADGDSGFSFFSLLSVLAFFMGAGWMGLTCRIDWGMSSFASAVAATGFGTAMMGLASGLMFATRKLNQTVEYDLATAVGRTARVYLSVPARGAGRGQIEVDVSGRRKIVEAISNGGKIPQFTSVRVVEVRDDGAMVVEPTD